MNLDQIDEVIESKLVNFNKYPENIRELSLQNPNIEVIRIKYLSDKLKIEGFIAKKKGIKHKSPTIIFCRGGNNLQHLGEILPGTFLRYLKFLLDSNYVIFASNYRGSTKSEGKDEFGGSDVNDVINLYPIINKYKYSDPDNISLYGVSRGCMQALLVHRQIRWIKSIVLLAGMYNYSLNIKHRPSFYRFLTEDFKLTKDDLYNRSAINFVNDFSKNVPILLLHGNNDDKVTAISSMELGIKLQENENPYKLIVYPDGDHGITQHILEVRKEIVNWFNKFTILQKQDGGGLNLTIVGKNKSNIYYVN